MNYDRSKVKRHNSSAVQPLTVADNVTTLDSDDDILNPPGLSNLGNTCYINATLQCLLTIHPLVDWLLSQPHLNNSGFCDLEGPLLTPVLSDLVVAIFKKNYTAELANFRDVIGELVKDFKEPREQDAQEFLLFLLNRLHDEHLLTVGNSNPHMSNISSIFEGILHTQLLCSRCTQENHRSGWNLFKSHSKSFKGNKEVFLSLSLPIPVQMDQLKAATDNVDSNASHLNVVFNEIIDSNPIVCYRRLLKLHPSADVQSIYNQVFSLPQFSSTPAPSSKFHQSSMPNSQRSFKENNDFTSPSTRNPFLLIQVKSTGFGDWFLESSGCALDLVDGLNVEDDFGTSTARVARHVEQSLLTGDALFIVRLNGKLASDVPQPSDMTLLPSTTPCSVSATSETVNESKFLGSTDRQLIDSNSSNMSGSNMQLLLVHVMNRNPTDSYADDFDSAQAANFRRFSPPISMSVSNDIGFDDLRSRVLRSLKAFGGPQYDQSITLDHAKESLRFWIVDAAPGEPREIDSRHEFPLLHSTIEVSSIILPQWLSKEGQESPRLLRLLVVWPYTSRYRNPTFRVEMDASLAVLTSPNAGGVESDRTLSLRSSKSKGSKHDVPLQQNPSSTLTITKCLEEFKASTNLNRIDNFTCSKCGKSQNSGLLTTKIEKAPSYLLLHLNRFVHVPPSAGGGNGLMKINSLVDYPINNLDLSFMMDLSDKSRKSHRKNKDSDSGAQDEPIYELVAVCSHKGSIETGHITAYCRNLFTHQWWHYNDMKVQKVSSDQVVQPSAYLLFYKRKNGGDPATVQRIKEKVERIAGKNRSEQEHSGRPKEPPEVLPKRTSTSLLPCWFTKRPRL
ncbi:hypothetical protein Aperf_G00000005532 [Anoplocephala perfoliata]